MALRAKLVWQVVVNGATPFIFNFAATLNWSIRNHMIQKYAEPSGHELGAAMASFGVVMTVYHVAMTPTVGFAMGMQPLVGYNMGARHYRRVRRIFLTSLVLAWLLLMVPFLGLEVFARPVFRMFGAEGDALSLGVYTLRRYVSLLPFGGVCVLFAHYFQGTGQAGRALLISSVRQIFLALPLMVLMPVCSATTASSSRFRSPTDRDALRRGADGLRATGACARRRRRRRCRRQGATRRRARPRKGRFA